MTTATQFAKRGDWIETEVQNPRPAKLRARLDTPEACAHGNELIAAGRWRVCRQCEWTEHGERCTDPADYLVAGGLKAVCEGHAALVASNHGRDAVQDLPSAAVDQTEAPGQ